MGIPVLILGASGSGKSTSIRNFDPDEVRILNVAGKPLPFRKKIPKADNVTYGSIISVLKKAEFKKYVIDDSQYLMAFEMFDKAKDTGYGKFTDIALNFRNLIDFVIRGLPGDIIVYFLHHTDEQDNGKVRAKTVGKMLDNQLTVEGLFSIVLLCTSDGNTHKFITQSDGYTTCKSPIEMFEREIDNDLVIVDKAIREYWELNNQGSEEKGE